MLLCEKLSDVWHDVQELFFATKNVRIKREVEAVWQNAYNWSMGAEAEKGRS